MKSETEIVGWLREKVAKETQKALSDISLETPFASLGLDSIVIVTLAADLEEWLNISLDPTVFWEYPTIHQLTEWIVAEKLGSQVAGIAPGHGP